MERDYYFSLRKKYSKIVIILFFPFVLGLIGIAIEGPLILRLQTVKADFLVFKDMFDASSDGAERYFVNGYLKESGVKASLNIGEATNISNIILGDSTIPVWYFPGNINLIYRDSDHFDATSHIIKASIFSFLVLIFLFALIKYLYYRNLDNKLNYQNG